MPPNAAFQSAALSLASPTFAARFFRRWNAALESTNHPRPPIGAKGKLSEQVRQIFELRKRSSERGHRAIALHLLVVD